MFLRLIFISLFIAFSTITSIAQQVDWIRRADINNVYDAGEIPRGFHQDNTGNFYMVMDMIKSYGFPFNLNFFGTPVSVPDPYKNYWLLSKFDKNMNLIWAKPFRIEHTGIVETKENLVVDQANNIYFANTDTTYKFTSTGNLIWKKRFSGHSIKINKQGQLEVYRFKNASNSIAGSPILNRAGTVVTLDTVGNYLRHFTLHNSKYFSQVILGKNEIGYFGIRTANTASGSQGLSRQEFFTCDSSGNTLNYKLLNYNYYPGVGSTPHTFPNVVYDPLYQKYYVLGIFRDITPINKRDSTTAAFGRLSLVQLDNSLQVSKVLYLGKAPQNVIYAGGRESFRYFMRTYKGNLYFTSNVDNIFNYPFYTHLGLLNYHGIDDSGIILGKIDNNLNPKWFMNQGKPGPSNQILYPIPTNNGIYYCGKSQSFSNKYVTFTTSNSGDVYLMKITDKDSTTAKLSGRIYKDLNQNGLDDNEPAVLGQSISNNMASGISYSANNGTFNLAAITGQNKLQSSSLPQYWVRSTPDSIIVNVPASSAQLSGFNFGMYPVPGIKDASVNLTPMTVARINMPVMHQLTYNNSGTDILSGKVKVVKAPELIFQNATITPTTVSGDTLTWNYTGLAPNETRQIRINYTLPNNQTIVDKNLLNIATITPLSGDTAKVNNTSEFYHRVTGPVDPNDITVTPSCPITPAFISNKEYLEYRIRFQNIGTDTAFSVVIKDTLSTNFDFTSLDFVDQSHNAKISLKDNVLILYFENIKLPHSAVNYLGSHGFFTYRVKVKANTTVGSSIKNKAAIFFDYNAPIITNQITTPVTSTQIPFTTTIQNLLCNKANNGQISISNTCSAAPVRYSLDSVNFQSTPVFSNLAAGTYSIWIKTGNKQYKLTPLQIQQPDSISATINLQHASSGNGAINVVATGGIGSFKYSLNSGAYQSGSNFSNLPAGNYQISIKDLNNCVKTYTVIIRNIAGTKEDASTGLKVYPNPFTHTIQLETDKLPDTPVEIYNTLGQLVYTQEIRTHQTSLDLKELSKGIYLLKVNSGKGYSMHKIIKE